MIIRKKEEYFIYILLFLCFTTCYYQNTYLEILFFIFFSVLYFSKKIKVYIILGYLTSMMSNMYTLPRPILGVYEVYKIIFFLIFMNLFLQFKNYKKIKIRSKTLFIFSVVLIVNLLSLYNTQNYAVGVYWNFFMLFNLFIFILLSDVYKFSKNDIYILIKSSCFLIALLFINSIINKDLSRESLTLFSLVDWINKNTFALCITILNTINITGAYNIKERKFNLIPIICYSLGIIFLVFSGSRTSLFSSIFAGVIFYIWLFKYLKKNIKIISMLFLSIIIILCLNFILSNEVIKSRLNLELFLNEKGGLRFIGWHNLFKYVFKDYFLTGVGLSTINEILALKASANVRPIASHNIVVAILIETGIIGLIGYFFTIFIIFKNKLNKLKKNSFYITLLLVIFSLFVCGVGENIFTEPYFWISLGILNGMRE